MKLYVNLFAFLSFIPFLSSAQENLFFDRLNVEDGLSDRTVYCIEQDSEGFIWFGTESGLDRYDGYDIVPFMTDNGDNGTLYRKTVSCLHNDSCGRLWIGTRCGLYIYDPIVPGFSEISPDIDSLNILRAGNIRTLFEDSGGIIWAGTREGLVMYDVDNARIKHYDLVGIDGDVVRPNETRNQNIVRSIAEDSYGRIWIGTFDGLFVLERKSDHLREVKVSNRIHLDPGNNLILSLFFDVVDPNILWVGTETGMHRLDVRTESYVSYRKEVYSECFSNNVIKCIVSYSDDKFLLGTDYGLNIFDLNSCKSDCYMHDNDNLLSIGNNVIWDIFKDRDGDFWMATENGVSRILSSELDLEIYNVGQIREPIEYQENIVKGIVTDTAGNRWIALHDRVICETLSGTREEYRFNNATDMKVRTLHVGSNGIVWVGTTNSLWYKDKSDMFFRKVGGDCLKYVTCIKEDDAGRIWVNSIKGIARIQTWREDNQELQIEVHDYDICISCSDHSVSISCLGIEKKGTYIWAGTLNSEVYRLDTRSGDISTVNIKSGNLRNISVLDFIESDSLYMLTRNALFVYDEISGYLLPKENCVWENNFLNAAETDNYGNIWISTHSGFIWLDIHTGGNKFFDLSEYSYNGGIERRPGLLHRDKTGKMWAPSYDTYFAFSPQRTYDEDVSRQLKISSVEVNGVFTHYTHDKKGRPLLHLDYANNTVSVNVSMLVFASSESIKYSFMLEGMDKKWTIPDADNRITYHSIPSGKYVLELAAVSSCGTRYATQKIFINVSPPWWESWYAYAFYSFVLLSLVYYSWRMWRERVRLAEEMRIEKIHSEAEADLIRHKERFFTNVSHEFRTPLTLILGPVENLYEKWKDITSRSQLDMIKMNAERLLRLVSQIMDFSKLEYDTLKLNLSDGDMVVFLKREFDMFSTEAVSKNIIYTFDCEFSSFFTKFDEDKLEKTVYNLLSNAFKHTPSGGAIHLGLKSAPNGGIYVYVSDSGIGIPENERQAIFERYYQSSYTRDIPGGTGIGLSMVKDYVNLSGGKVSVDNKPGGGAVFVVWLPLERSNIEDCSCPDENKFEDGKPVILVVDDNAEMCTFMKSSLESEYNVLVAGNGSDALSKILSMPPDIIVSDLMMPEMSGIELCRIVKGQETTSHIPFILLTAVEDHESIYESFETGADDYITKPFNIKLLKIRLEKHLDLRRKVQEYFRNKLKYGDESEAVSDVALSNKDPFVDRVTDLIRTELSNENMDVQFLCERLKLPKQQVYRKIKALTGYTVIELIRTVRMQEAAERLRGTSDTVTEIMYAVGYSNNSYFSKCFSDTYGLTPTEYRKKSTHG